MKRHRTWPVTAFASLLAMPVAGHATAERVTEAVTVSGVVFQDDNRNGVRDPGESGMPGVAVSDQVQVVNTDASGRFTIAARGYGVVFVSQPEGYLVNGPFWRSAASGAVDFGLTPISDVSSFTFVHASDTHLDEASAPRVRRMREIVDSLQPAFVLITGDLVRDALRVPESTARSYYELVEHELSQFTVPVFTVPGNHEKFGIERERSGVPKSHPLYGNHMYRSYRGPNYYSFTYGGVHFLGLDTVDYDDMRYHGHVDSLQLGWLTADVAATPAGTPLVTFNHLPFIGGGESRSGLSEGGNAPSVIEIDGRAYFRHSVYNQADVLAPIQDRLQVSLQGHIHMREVLEYQTQKGVQRLITAAAVVGPRPGRNDYGPLSGITLHRVTDGHVGKGTFLPLDPIPSGR